jgi:hypothetical protein
MAWLPFAKLEITDGTTTINLINMQSSGFCITGWEPAIQDLKAGGTWADPPTADERELIVSQLANVEEQYTFDVSAASPDELIGKLRDLRAMLEKGRQYVPTEWQDTPVDIIAQGYGDSNERYARVKNWRTPNDGFPYGPPMWDTIEGTAIEDFQIIIERGAWQENRSGVGTATEISAVETYDGRNLGNVDSAGARQTKTTKEVFLYNSDQNSNLTHVYVDDGGVFGPNLMDAALPYSLFPAVPVVGDAIYFGIQEATLTNNVGMITSLVFDIGTAGAGYTGVWETFLIAAWTTAVPEQDNTNNGGAGGGTAFDTAGVGSVHFDPFGVSQDQTTVNGVAGWWVRYRITGTPGAITVPTQQNRDIYHISWNYTEIQETDISGDIPALMQFKMYDRADTDGSGGSAPDAYADRVVVGLRSTSRGENFRSILNCINNLSNPTGVTVTTGANTVFSTAAAEYPSAGVAVYTPPGAQALADRVIFTLSASLMQEYYGTFRILGRFRGASDKTVRLRATVGSGGISVFSDELALPATSASQFAVFDLGVINIPSGKLNSTEEGDQTEIALQASSASGANNVVFLDIALIPVDEWAGDFSFTEENSAALLQRVRYLNVDSVTYPKAGIRSILFNESNDRAVSFYLTVANDDAILQANTKQRLWFFAMRAVYAAGVFDYYESNPISAYVIQMFRNQRYWSMRGAG